jgi:hypothetical protein
MYWSCNQAVSYYGRENVILITDTFGQTLFKDKLRFPYAEVRTDLDTLADFKLTDMWAYSKVQAYKQMDTPFLHIDTDWVFTKPLPKVYESADIVVQHFEQGAENRKILKKDGAYSRVSGYTPALEMLNKLPYLPAPLSQLGDLKIFPYLGIFGGQNIDLVQRYCNIVEDLITNEENQQMLEDMVAKEQDIRFFNVLIESIAAGAVLAAEKVSALSVFQEIDYKAPNKNTPTENKYTPTEDEIKNIGVVHLMGMKQKIPARVITYVSQYSTRDPKIHKQLSLINSWLPKLIRKFTK